MATIARSCGAQLLGFVRCDACEESPALPPKPMGLRATVFKPEGRYIGRCGLYPNRTEDGEIIPGEAQAAFDWTDVTRRFVPPEKKIYSWWSYRAADWEASDRGRRLDHIWASPGIAGALKSQTIFKKMRGWQKASDHVPVMVDVDI